LSRSGRRFGRFSCLGTHCFQPSVARGSCRERPRRKQKSCPIQTSYGRGRNRWTCGVSPGNGPLTRR
jgi:hypothetical protein